jgi:hypothetical protein
MLLMMPYKEDEDNDPMGLPRSFVSGKPGRRERRR